MKIKSMTFLFFLTISILSGCDDKTQITQDIAIKNKQTIQQTPVFNLKTVDGKLIKIIANKSGWNFKGFENKIILLDFFGTWCPPCKAEIPHLNNIRSKIKNDFEIIGLEIGTRRGTATSHNKLVEFIKDFDIQYPITTGVDNIKLYHAVKELNVNGSIPFMILFNKKGQYVTHYVGMVPQEMIQSDIEQILGE